MEGGILSRNPGISHKCEDIHSSDVCICTRTSYTAAFILHIVMTNPPLNAILYPLNILQLDKSVSM